MAERRNRQLTALAAVVTVEILMWITEEILKPGYWTKAAIKIVVFSAAVAAYSLLHKEDILSVINLRKIRPSGKTIALMVLAYLGIVAGFFAIRGFLDLKQIRDNLIAKEHLSRENFIFIFSYIIIVNSFIEEAFFRGLVFHAFKKAGREKAGWIISALSFAVYHLGIVSSWLNPLMLAACIAALAIAGGFLQYVEEKSGSLCGSWMVHGCANLAINTIGTILLFSQL